MTPAAAMLIFALSGIIGVLVSYYDLKTMTIPNWLTAGTAALFAVVVLIAMGVEPMIFRLLGALAVLAVCFLLFWAGQIGGGDAKAAAAFTILIAPVDASFVLLALAVNGLIGLGVLHLLRRTPLSQSAWKVWSEGKQYPYGLALSMTLVLYTGLVAMLAR